ncbi:MAG: YidC/Oxa1 family membrane protein insertase [bacterium]|nr:YidC/Oxa1 family membrane protein insertase [bacterium]
MKALFIAVVYQPLYNGLVFLMDILPWADAGVVVVLFTVLIKLILFPLSQKAVKTQLQMKGLEGRLNEIKKKYEKDAEGKARAMMDLYKNEGINPFSGILLILIQIPIILALYFIFLRGGLPVINTDLLYGFVSVPTVDMEFLGLLNIAEKSFILALAAGISQFFQVRLAMPKLAASSGQKSFKEDLVRSMNLQMRYVMPVIVFFISFSISGAVALYWTTSNIFAIGQELYARKNRLKI